MDLFELIQSGDVEKLQKAFKDGKKAFKGEETFEDIQKQYNVEGHDVFDDSIREKKKINKDTGQKDEKGNPVTQTDHVEVTRVGLPFQEIIVDRAVGFLLGNKIKLSGTIDKDNEKENNLFKLVERIWKDNKLDYRNKEVARRLFSEREVAELWYWVEDKGGFWDNVSKLLGLSKGTFTLKTRILSPGLGDTLYPLFDSTGDMVAFGREYVLKEGGKDITHFDVYTAEMIYKWKKTDAWEAEEKSLLKTPLVKFQLFITGKKKQNGRRFKA